MTNEEINKVLKVKNRLGLHARAAAIFVRLSNKFSSDIKLAKDGYKVDGKSILGVLSLAAVQGSHIEITATGVDAEEAIREIEKLVDSGFGEDT